MIAKKEIILAIGKHIWWEQEFAKAVSLGRQRAYPGSIQREDECNLGRWLAGLSTADRLSKHFETVHSLHTKLHAEAANAMSLSLSGGIASPELSMAMGLFATTSKALIGSLRDWMIATTCSEQVDDPTPAFNSIGALRTEAY